MVKINENYFIMDDGYMFLFNILFIVNIINIIFSLAYLFSYYIFIIEEDVEKIIGIVAKYVSSSFLFFFLFVSIICIKPIINYTDR